jgi:hypothetical protein
MFKEGRAEQPTETSGTSINEQPATKDHKSRVEQRRALAIGEVRVVVKIESWYGAK